jgi:hypothetical protein
VSWLFVYCHNALWLLFPLIERFTCLSVTYTLIFIHITNRGEWLALLSCRFISGDSFEYICVGPRTGMDPLEIRTISCLSRKCKHDYSDIQLLDQATRVEQSQHQLEVASRID